MIAFQMSNELDEYSLIGDKLLTEQEFELVFGDCENPRIGTDDGVHFIFQVGIEESDVIEFCLERDDLFQVV